MSVKLNDKTGKWDVRVQKDGVRRRYGSYDTEAIARAKEMTIKYEEDVMDFDEQEPKYTRYLNPFNWFKKNV